MYIGVGVFAFAAIICVIAGATAMKRRRDSSNRDGGVDDDFDFDKYEGFDKE